MLLVPSNLYNLPPLQAGSGGGGGGGKKGKGKKGKGGKGRASPDPEDEEVAQVCLFRNISRAHIMILPKLCEIGTTSWIAKNFLYISVYTMGALSIICRNRCFLNLGIAKIVVNSSN